MGHYGPMLSATLKQPQSGKRLTGQALVTHSGKLRFRLGRGYEACCLALNPHNLQTGVLTYNLLHRGWPRFLIRRPVSVVATILMYDYSNVDFVYLRQLIGLFKQRLRPPP